MMQYSERVWKTQLDASGSSFSDVGDLQTTWDTTRGQAGDAGIITNFVGGARGIAIGDGTAEARAVEVQPWLDTVFPGTAAAYVADSAVRMHWPTHPHTLGSYACYRPGQWAFYGLEGERFGKLHFAGEHCSLDFQGYMEGAAETGLAVAVEILDDLAAEPSARHAALLGELLALPHPCFQRGGDVRPRRQQRRAARRALRR
jgi:monoamine oxidase